MPTSSGSGPCPGNLCALDLGKETLTWGDPYLGTLPAGPEEGGWCLLRLGGACRWVHVSPPAAPHGHWALCGEHQERQIGFCLEGQGL